VRGEVGQRLMGFAPPCECADCEQQFRNNADQCRLIYRYRSILSRKEAEMVAAKLTFNIKRNLEYLRRECASHGNVIINRWKKKNRQKREKILLAADPNMYPEQWLIPRHLIAFESDTEWQKVRERHKSYLLPYITIPDLRDDPSKLLSLLFYRTQSLPEVWAPFDSKRLSNGWFSSAFDVDYRPESIIMYGPRYGELTEWDKLKAERWQAVGFPRGKLILEAQESMMALLRAVVEQLVDGIDSNSSLGSDKWVCVLL